MYAVKTPPTTPLTLSLSKQGFGSESDPYPDQYSLICWILIRILNADPDLDPRVQIGFNLKKGTGKPLKSSFFPFFMINFLLIELIDCPI